MNFNTNIPDLSDLKKIYDENGYNHIPELFSKSDMELINKEFDRYIKDCVPKMKEGEVYYVDKTNKDTLTCWSLDKSFSIFIIESQLTLLASSGFFYIMELLLKLLMEK